MTALQELMDFINSEKGISVFNIVNKVNDLFEKEKQQIVNSYEWGLKDGKRKNSDIAKEIANDEGRKLIKSPLHLLECKLGKDCSWNFSFSKSYASFIDDIAIYKEVERGQIERAFNHGKKSIKTSKEYYEDNYEQ